MITINYALVIVIMNFILLLVVLNKLLYKPIKQFLTERQKKISDDIDEAKASRKEAAQLVIEKEDDLKGSAEEIRKMKNASRRDAENQASEIMKSAKNQEKKILKDTEDQLQNEKTKVMQEIEGELATMISDLSAKFISGKLDEKGDQKLIKKMLTERGKSEK